MSTIETTNLTRLVSYIGRHGIAVEVRGTELWAMSESTQTHPDGSVENFSTWERIKPTLTDVRNWLGY